jgi:hypothetical protein
LNSFSLIRPTSWRLAADTVSSRLSIAVTYTALLVLVLSRTLFLLNLNLVEEQLSYLLFYVVSVIRSSQSHDTRQPYCLLEPKRFLVNLLLHYFITRINSLKFSLETFSHLFPIATKPH